MALPGFVRFVVITGSVIDQGDVWGFTVEEEVVPLGHALIDPGEVLPLVRGQGDHTWMVIFGDDTGLIRKSGFEGHIGHEGLSFLND